MSDIAQMGEQLRAQDKIIAEHVAHLDRVYAERDVARAERDEAVRERDDARALVPSKSKGDA